MWLVAIVILSCSLPAQSFTCFKDDCEAGHQYCVDESRRCYHCKDLQQPCDNKTMLSDCRAFCTELELRSENGKLEQQFNQLTGNLTSTREEMGECKDSITNLTTRLWVSIIANVCLTIISVSLIITFTLKRKTKMPPHQPEEKGLLCGLSMEHDKSSLFNEKRRSGDSALGSTSRSSTGSDDVTDDVIRDLDHEQRLNGAEIGQTYEDFNIGIQERGEKATESRDESLKSTVLCNPGDEFFKSTLLCGPGENEKETNFMN